MRSTSFIILKIFVMICAQNALAIGPYDTHDFVTVIDESTNLQWQRATADVNEDGVITGSDALNWASAMAYCENLDFADYSDWRLPNLRELFSIVDFSREGPAIDPIFQTFLAYWSSTTLYIYVGEAQYVNFQSGGNRGVPKDSPCYVRCVRGGLSGKRNSGPVFFPVKNKDGNITIIYID